MTRAAELTTFTFEGEDDVWAATTPVILLPGGDFATRDHFVDWFRRQLPRQGILDRWLGPPHPSPISTALHAPALGYRIVSDQLFLDWVGFSLADAERLDDATIPLGGELRRFDDHLAIRFASDRPLPLANPVDLARCEFSHGVHSYLTPGADAERRIAVDGEVLTLTRPGH